MNTPSHAVVNLSLLASWQPQAILPIVIGAVLPDVPMFVMYFWAKQVRHQSDRQIWTETYWTPFWQNMTHTFHSIPLKLLGIAIAHLLGWQLLEILFLSALLHSLGDFPIHNHDAHRHFLPFSNYRFISPLSYWDPRHHSRIVSLVEKLLVLVASFYLFPILDSWIARTALVAVNVAYLSGYFSRSITRKCVQAKIQHEIG
ncbi:hypothetical protein K9N68_27835 [Kovacikia minuta CCNUW1]|uniref:hypothetical protein n=1 Tax=Kovacikia minuta TaxID=2931930 RepID=UPI001CCCC013|nr:hypothetical protein [Kovacikia minuta]UBF25376.1 hypothetical protein K9N68_27835 [Kovacikia minuta CCNUW1]